MRKQLSIQVISGQVVVYLTHLERPWLLWTDDHVAQGFAWNDGTVSFGVPDHDGHCRLCVDTDATGGPDLPADTLWAIRVPFIARRPKIQVGTVVDDTTFDIEVGAYDLIFDARPGAGSNETDCAYILSLTFVRPATGSFAILKQGELQSGHVISTTSTRA